MCDSCLTTGTCVVVLLLLGVSKSFCLIQLSFSSFHYQECVLWNVSWTIRTDWWRKEISGVGMASTRRERKSQLVAFVYELNSQDAGDWTWKETETALLIVPLQSVTLLDSITMVSCMSASALCLRTPQNVIAVCYVPHRKRNWWERLTLFLRGNIQGWCVADDAATIRNAQEREPAAPQPCAGPI